MVLMSAINNLRLALAMERHAIDLLRRMKSFDPSDVDVFLLFSRDVCTPGLVNIGVLQEKKPIVFRLKLHTSSVFAIKSTYADLINDGLNFSRKIIWKLKSR